MNADEKFLIDVGFIALTLTERDRKKLFILRERGP